VRTITFSTGLNRCHPHRRRAARIFLLLSLEAFPRARCPIRSSVSGWRSHLSEPSFAEEDRVHLTFWWTREHFRAWLRGSTASTSAQR
jgi:hypothetical protein